MNIFSQQNAVKPYIMYAVSRATVLKIKHSEMFGIETCMQSREEFLNDNNKNTDRQKFHFSLFRSIHNVNRQIKVNAHH